MRGEFGKSLVEIAEKDTSLYLFIGDYESGVGEFKKRFPSRYVNMGTAEQALVSGACGLFQEGIRPLLYGITPFILERPFEQIKSADQQKARIIIVGYDDYPTQGPTHVALDAPLLTSMLKNTRSYFPKNSAETRAALYDAHAYEGGPAFIGLKRAPKGQ